MKPERILVPIDTARCHPEVFNRVNAFVGRPGVTVILLHVLHLNIAAPDNRVYEELAWEARWHLEQLAREFLHPGVATLFHVRIGKPVHEILAEAETEAADLIILCISGGRNWGHRAFFPKRLLAPWFGGTSQRLVRQAACPLLVVQAEGRFNCHGHWGRQTSDIQDALHYLRVTSGTGSSSDLAPEASQAKASEPSRVAA
jgi:nucleotide-binding universal stress UspA family protein